MRRAFLFWICLLMVLTTSESALAGKHPVELDPKADSSTCIQCHDAQSKGPIVHSAIAMGCTSCHEVRVSKGTTRIKLITTTSVSLCITCHADKKASDIKGKVHSPAVRDCVTCHDPHTSGRKNQLLKDTSGDTRDTNLCLGCHKVGVDVPKDGSRHAALDMGCDTCHVTHKTGERGKREFDFHLVKDAPALCIGCHDVKDAALIKAHQNQPFESADCLTCHNPHQSSQKKLMAKFTHMPFAGGQCDSCHAPAKSGKVVLTQESSKALCLTCHSDKSEQIEKAKVQHPGAAGDCTDCHNPHASSQPGLPKTNGVDICLTCHTDQAEQGKKAHLHQPVFEQGCTACHEPHGGNNLHLLRAKTVNSLCLECHGSESTPQKLESEHLVTVFDGKVKLPENYFANVAVLSLRYGLGHPVAGHPTVDVMDKQDLDKVKTPINCLTCHQPHSSAQRGLLVKDQANDMAFCGTCHTAKGFVKAQAGN